MKQVLIIGTLGFVGYSLCSRLLEDGVTVIGLDHKPYENTIHEEKLLGISRNANFTFIPLKQEMLLKRDLENSMVDVVFYCLPISDNDGNIERNNDMEKLLELAIDQSLLNKCKFVIVASRVQGNGRSKEENYVINQCENLDYMIVKLPTLYGPWQPFEMVYQQLILAKINGVAEAINIEEDTRDILYIDDAIEGILSLLPQEHEKEIQIESGLKFQWYEGIKEISPEVYEELRTSAETSENIQNDKCYTQIISKTSIRKGIENKIKHTEKLKKRLF